MRSTIRRAPGKPPADGQRVEERVTLAGSATLHSDAAIPRAVTLADLTPRGCRLVIASDLTVATHVSVMLDGATLISGRVAWNDGQALGVDFCRPLLPKTVWRLGGEAPSA